MPFNFFLYAFDTNRLLYNCTIWEHESFCNAQTRLSILAELSPFLIHNLFFILLKCSIVCCMQLQYIDKYCIYNCIYLIIIPTQADREQPECFISCTSTCTCRWQWLYIIYKYCNNQYEHVVCPFWTNTPCGTQ